jgi:hypothetical protein
MRPLRSQPVNVVAASPRCDLRDLLFKFLACDLRDLLFKFLACRHLRVGRTFETFVAGTTNVGYWKVRVTDRHDQ